MLMWKQSITEWEKRDTLKKLRGAMVKDVHLEHIHIEKLIKKQRSFVSCHLHKNDMIARTNLPGFLKRSCSHMIS